MNWQEAAIVCGLAVALSLAFVPVARRSALILDVTDRPAAGKVHKLPTPCLGGVAVVAAVLVGTVIVGGWRGEAVAILAAAILVAAIGLVDDIRTITPRLRMMVEAVAAVIAFTAGARVELLGGFGDLALTVIWLVVLTNAYNLLDNMDACASMMVGASGAALTAAAVLNDQLLVANLAGAVVGAAAGFLVYNWHPARIFLGDAGSLFLGFLISAVALKLRFPVSHDAGALAVVLVAAPALFDTSLVVISRRRAGRPVYVGGTDHTSHRLVALGFTTRQVAVVLAAVSALCGALGIAVGRALVDPWAVIVPAALLGMVLLAVLLRVPSDAGRAIPLPVLEPAQPSRARPSSTIVG